MESISKDQEGFACYQAGRRTTEHALPSITVPLGSATYGNIWCSTLASFTDHLLDTAGDAGRDG